MYECFICMYVFALCVYPEVQTEGPETQDHLQLQSEFQVSLGYRRVYLIIK